MKCCLNFSKTCQNQQHVAILCVCVIYKSKISYEVEKQLSNSGNVFHSPNYIKSISTRQIYLKLSQFSRSIFTVHIDRIRAKLFVFSIQQQQQRKVLISMPNEDCSIYHWHYPNNTFFSLLSHDGIPSFTFVVCWCMHA